MAFTTRGRTQTALADINITPLVDVVLVLLLIFMLTAPVLQSGITVNVPNTKTVEEVVEQHEIVSIDKDQNVFVSGKPVKVDAIGAAIGPAKPGTKQIVYIEADKTVPFGAFVSVMDALKQAHITNISVVTHPTEGK